MIGVPLISFPDGSFVGMNFYDGRTNRTPFMPRKNIVKVLHKLEPPPAGRYLFYYLCQSLLGKIYLFMELTLSFWKTAIILSRYWKPQLLGRTRTTGITSVSLSNHAVYSMTNLHCKNWTQMASAQGKMGKIVYLKWMSHSS